MYMYMCVQEHVHCIYMLKVNVYTCTMYNVRGHCHFLDRCYEYLVKSYYRVQE